MTKLLKLYFGHDLREHAGREAFMIGLSRLADPRPRLPWHALEDTQLFVSPYGDIGSDWCATGGDLRAALDAVRAK